MMYSIPLSGGRDISIGGPFPLSEQDWDQFMTVLEAMKPGLVKAEAS